MTNFSNDILPDSFLNEGRINRKQLLPIWIKIFAWIFIVFALIVPVAIVVGIITHNFAISLYGLETNSPFSTIGVLLMVIYLFKGIVAFGFLKREDWAVNLGIIDAVLGIVICISLTIFPIATSSQSFFRLELIALIPYLIKLLKVKDGWRLGQKN